MSVLDFGNEATNESFMVNDALSAVTSPGIGNMKTLFQKHGSKLSMASSVLKKIPNPKAQIAAKCIDAGIMVFNSGKGQNASEQFDKLGANKDKLLNSFGVVGNGMSADSIYANKMMAGMKNGLNFDDAEKGTIGFMSKMGFSPKQISGILDGKSINFLNGGSLKLVNSVVDALQPKEISEQTKGKTKENTLSLGSVFDLAGKAGRASRGERGGRE